MKTEILVEMTTLKIYRISPDANKLIPDSYFDSLNKEIENLKKIHSSFLSEEYSSKTNEYEILIIFKE